MPFTCHYFRAIHVPLADGDRRASRSVVAVLFVVCVIRWGACLAGLSAIQSPNANDEPVMIVYSYEPLAITKGTIIERLEESPT